MSQITSSRWKKQTDETRGVEKVLRDAGFERVDVYRYNLASIRVRVIDRRFEGLSDEKRDAMVEPHLEGLPERTQADIISLFTFAPSELGASPSTLKELLMNAEFEDPSPSRL
jgi:hypothetical protein